MILVSFEEAAKGCKKQLHILTKVYVTNVTVQVLQRVPLLRFVTLVTAQDRFR